MYFPIDIINSVNKKVIYNYAMHDSCIKYIDEYAKYKNIDNIKKYIDSEGEKQFVSEIDSWQRKVNYEEYTKSLVVNEAIYFNKILTFFWPLIFGFAFLSLFLYLNRKMKSKYIICPYKDCKKSILVYGKWICEYCNNKQTTDKFVDESCSFCGRSHGSEMCEHCGRQFYI